MGLFDKPTPAQTAVARIQGELNATVTQVTRSLANIRARPRSRAQQRRLGTR